MKYLMLMSLLIMSCALRDEVVEENVRIHIATDALRTVNPDSVSGTISQTGTSGYWTVQAACDTTAKECQVVLDDATHAYLILDLTFYKDQMAVVTLSSKGLDIGSNSATLSFASGDVEYTEEGYALYSKSLQCETGSPNCLTDVRQGGRNYRTVTIGKQTWMAENLDFQVNDNAITGAKSFCYDLKEMNCRIHGRIYNWYALFDGTVAEGTQGICPGGWHIPTDHEWTILEMSQGLAASDTAIMQDWRGTHAPHMRLTDSTWGAGYLEMNDDNKSGFSIIPGGVWDGLENSFSGINDDASFWTSTSVDPSISSGVNAAIKRKFGPDQAGSRRDWHHKVNGYSLRCIKN